MKDLKYLLAYTVPMSVFVSFESTGIWTYSAVMYAFVILPILDVLAGEVPRTWTAMLRSIRTACGSSTPCFISTSPLFLG